MVEQFEVKTVRIEKGNSCVYNINYHIVFCPKYRKRVLEGKIKEDLELIFKTIIETNNWTLIEMQIMSDHIHIFASAHPKTSPLELIKKLKGISARLLFKKYPKFQKKEFWGKHLWSGGYYIGTAGIVTAESIQKYIQANTMANSSDS